MTSITAEGRTYPAYVAAPATGGQHPALVLLHSFNGLEPGYRTMCDEIAGAGFVVVAPEWQTYGQRAGDDEVESVIRSAVGFLQNRSDVDAARLGLTGFCAGGRYTMLFLPQMQRVRGRCRLVRLPVQRRLCERHHARRVRRGPREPDAHDPRLPRPGEQHHGHLQLHAPARRSRPVLRLKVYQGKPHGFMIQNGTLARDDAAQDAYSQMITFFRRTLG